MHELTTPTTTNLVKSIHPEVAVMGPRWTRYGLAYQGGEAYANAVFIPHPKEDAAEVKARRKHLYALNYAAYVVNTWIGFLMRENPEIKASPAVDALLQNLDRRNHAAPAVITRALIDAMVYGTELIVIDKPMADGPVRSRADEIDRKLVPYWTLMPPQALRNFSADDMNVLEWALLHTPSVNQVLNMDKSTVTTIEDYRFTLWTREDFRHLDKDGKIVGEVQENPTGLVPIVPLRFQANGDSFFGMSLLTDIEPILREIVSTLSLLSEMANNQTFSTLVTQGELKAGSDPKTTAPKGPTRAIRRQPADPTITIGSTRGLSYGKGMNAPSFISPDASQAQMLLDILDMQVKEVMRIGQLKRGTATEKQAESGIAKAFDFLDFNQALSSMAGQGSEAFSEALRIQDLWMGGKGKPEDFTVTFRKDFGVNSASEMIADYVALNSPMSVDVPIELNREKLARIARADMPDMPEAEMKLLEAAIKATIGGDRANVRAISGGF